MRLGTTPRKRKPRKMTPCACGCGKPAIRKYATKACVPHHADRGRAKPLPSQRISLGRTRKQKAKAEAQHESWWLDYAQGERRDGEFMAEVERRFPGEAGDSMLLKEWVGAA